MAKDNFSGNSDQYALFRPEYPPILVEYICGLVRDPKTAWDCGTGNGQLAKLLSGKFSKVIATDLSQDQIKNAFQAKNIEYHTQTAESADFGVQKFDLITVAQAIHWFDFEKFFDVVRKHAHQETIFAVIGYGRVKINPEIDSILDKFYFEVIGSYWDKERRYVDDEYKSIPFPFDEINAPAFTIDLEWNIHHFEGYINTWSAVKHFVKANGYNPVEGLIGEIRDFWKPNEVKQVCFPILLRIGKVT